jgi:hypothetical protein
MKVFKNLGENNFIGTSANEITFHVLLLAVFVPVFYTSYIYFLCENTVHVTPEMEAWFIEIHFCSAGSLSYFP